MKWIDRVMQRGQPPEVAPYATTPRGYPYPLRSWPPDAAIDIQNLATAIDTDITGLPAAALLWNNVTISFSSGTAMLDVGAGVKNLYSGCTSPGGFEVYVPKDGIYRVTGYLECTGVAAGAKLRMRVGDGSGQPRGDARGRGSMAAALSNGEAASVIADFVPLAANDAVTIIRDTGSACTMKYGSLAVEFVRGL